MNTVIIYATNRGCTENCAKELANKLHGNTKLVNLESKGNPNLDDADSVIIGGSIQASSMNSKVTQYVSDNHSQITQKKVGLFICCFDDRVANQQFEDAFPNELKDVAMAKGLFGGELDFDKMSEMEKAIIKKVTGIDKSISNIHHQNIDDFAREINELA